MAAKKQRRGPLTAIEKMEKKLKEIDPDFLGSVHSSKTEDLEKRMLGYAKDMTGIENARDEDPDIKAKKEELKVLNSTYGDPLNAIKLKRKYIYKILGDRGKLP